MNNSNLRTLQKFFTIITGLMLLLSFSGCFSFGGTGDNTSTERAQDDVSKIYETNEYSIILPKDWEIIERADFTADIPRETDVVFRSNVKNETFTPTVAVVKKELLEPVTSLEYGKLVHNRQNLGLVDFNEISQSVIRVKVGDEEVETLFRIYEGRKAPDERMIRYQESYFVKGNNAYIVVGGTHPRETDTNIQTVERIVKSFQLK